MHVTCALCGLVVPMFGVDTGTLPVCKCVQAQSTFTTNVTMSAYDWNEQMKALRNWKVTLYGHVIQRPKHPVPVVFQDAFNDGALEL